MTLTLLSSAGISAEDFFQTIQDAKADLVIDCRLHNTNQLAGFTKEKDLRFFLRKIAGIPYVHDVRFAPDPKLLSAYLAKTISYDEYQRRYVAALERKGLKAAFFKDYGRYSSVVLIGSSTKKRRSHVEALKDYLEGK
jgi:hypothetical protein